MYFYEIKCNCKFDSWYYYFYVTSKYPIRSLRGVNSAVPEKVRLLLDDRYYFPCRVMLLNGFSYFYRKYIKKHFAYGSRVNWEKEKL